MGLSRPCCLPLWKTKTCGEWEGMSETVIIAENEYWTIEKFGPRYFTARAKPENNICKDEVRIYYSKDALERDFGGLIP